MKGVWFKTISKTIIQNSSLILIIHISKLYLSKKPKIENSCLVHNLNLCISFLLLNLFTFWWSPQPALSEWSCVSRACDLSPFTQTLSSLSLSLSLSLSHTHTHTHTHQMLEKSPSALLFRLHIHKTHIQQTPKEISQSSLLSSIAQFLPVSSIPFLLYGLWCDDFLLFLCLELTPKSKNWSTTISSKSYFPFHLTQSSIVVPDSTVFFVRFNARASVLS